jgi:DNA-directed RNA polymerase specialized sigma24 family protein
VQLEQVMALQFKGFTIEKIAHVLGVNVRTVKRDLAKAKPALLRHQKRQVNAVRTEDWKESWKILSLEATSSSTS